MNPPLGQQRRLPASRRSPTGATTAACTACRQKGSRSSRTRRSSPTKTWRSSCGWPCRPASPRCGSPAASRWCARACPTWWRMIRAIPDIWGISLTTNGVLLPKFAEELKAEGLDRVNISLDSLDPERYRELTRGGSLDDVLAGVEAALRVRSQPGEAERGHDARTAAGTAGLRGPHPGAALHVRFIEWMPVGGCGPGSAGEALTKAEVLAALEKLGAAKAAAWAFSSPWPRPEVGVRPSTTASRVTRVRWASSARCPTTSARECNRLRLTADGRLKNCLFSSHEVDVRAAVQARDEQAVTAVIAESLESKTFDKNELPGLHGPGHVTGRRLAWTEPSSHPRRRERQGRAWWTWAARQSTRRVARAGARVWMAPETLQAAARAGPAQGRRAGGGQGGRHHGGQAHLRAGAALPPPGADQGRPAPSRWSRPTAA